MIRHIIRRLLLAIPTLLAVFTIIFFIVRVARRPGYGGRLGDYASARRRSEAAERWG